MRSYQNTGERGRILDGGGSVAVRKADRGAGFWRGNRLAVEGGGGFQPGQGPSKCSEAACQTL